jgi:hypothetical protein
MNLQALRGGDCHCIKRRRGAVLHFDLHDGCDHRTLPMTTVATNAKSHGRRANQNLSNIAHIRVIVWASTSSSPRRGFFCHLDECYYFGMDKVALLSLLSQARDRAQQRGLNIDTQREIIAALVKEVLDTAKAEHLLTRIVEARGWDFAEMERLLDELDKP